MANYNSGVQYNDGYVYNATLASASLNGVGTASLTVNAAYIVILKADAIGTADASFILEADFEGSASAAGSATLNALRITSGSSDLNGIGTASASIFAIYGFDEDLNGVGTAEISSTTQTFAVEADVTSTGTASLDVIRVKFISANVSGSGSATLAVNRIASSAANLTGTGTASLDVIRLFDSYLPAGADSMSHCSTVFTYNVPLAVFVEGVARIKTVRTKATTTPILIDYSYIIPRA